ncbi:MAG: peptidoglycan hydrolase, partial [Neobacillus sp.]|nr:peptidoglycan hydrolase [Neobacillus sp.]
MAQIEFQQKKNKSTIWIFTGLMIAILLVISSILIYLYPFASHEKKTYFHGANPILFEGNQHGNAQIEGDTLFIPLTFLLEKIDDTILFDEKSQSVIITTAQKVIQMPTDSLTIFVNEKPVDLHVSP